MDKEFELKNAKFLDAVVSRCHTHSDAYEKISDFIKYTEYTDIYKDLSKEFKKMFQAKYCNAVVEGREYTFAQLYTIISSGATPKLKKNTNYSGLELILDEEDRFGCFRVTSNNKSGLTDDGNASEQCSSDKEESVSSCSRSTSACTRADTIRSSCGYSSSTSSCGSSRGGC